MPDWDDLEPVSDTADQQSPPQQSSAPDWDSMEPHNVQAPDWNSLQPLQAQPAPDSALTTATKSFARSAIPNTAGALSGLAVGAITSPAITPLGGAAAGVVTAGAVTYAAQKAQDAITDALGITDPAQEAANLEAHPTAALTGELGTAAITFGAGLEADLAKRALSGGMVGAVNVGQQYAETGSVDPTQALAATAVGAALPNTRGWAQDASGALASRLGGALKGRSGTQVNPNADVSTPAEQAEVTNTPVQTSPSEATAYEHGRTPDTLSDQTENPAAGMEAVPGGFSAGVGDLSRDQGKGSVPKGQGIPGAPSTTIDGITPGIGGQDAAAALQAEQPEPAPPAPSMNPKEPIEPINEP